MCSDTLQIPRLHLCVVSGVCGGGQAGGRAGEAGRGPVRPRVPGCLVPAPIFSAGCLTPINGAITSAKWDLACCGVCMFGWLLELDRQDHRSIQHTATTLHACSSTTHRAPASPASSSCRHVSLDGGSNRIASGVFRASWTASYLLT
jgi:hypothetical protein